MGIKTLNELEVDMEKVKKLIDSGKQVISDCSLENGAIVAANCFKNYFPESAKYYTYVWPRDASFTCVAADLVGLDIQEKFFDWCLTRAEGFQKTGLFYEKYFPNGLQCLNRFQPDQTGSILWAVWHHYKDDLSNALRYKKLVQLAADGICGKWEKDHFNFVTNDLWEERLTFPDLKENFTYSLAACVRGLECADLMFPNHKWKDVADLMKRRLEKHFDGYFLRSFGLLSDNRIDASMLGLVYPFETCSSNDVRMVSTIKKIEKRLLINGGLHRYENDDYDGWMYEKQHRKKGAGAWPLLNFWMSIYYSKKGDNQRALEYYSWVLQKVEDFIPEQIFENSIQVSVNPLCWSHSMFIIASEQLGLLNFL